MAFRQHRADPAHRLPVSASGRAGHRFGLKREKSTRRQRLTRVDVVFRCEGCPPGGFGPFKVIDCRISSTPRGRKCDAAG